MINCILPFIKYVPSLIKIKLLIIKVTQFCYIINRIYYHVTILSIFATTFSFFVTGSVLSYYLRMSLNLNNSSLEIIFNPLGLQRLTSVVLDLGLEICCCKFHFFGSTKLLTETMRRAVVSLFYFSSDLKFQVFSRVRVTEGVGLLVAEWKLCPHFIG